MGTTYKVWDKLNGDRENAKSYTTREPQEAAQLFAEDDVSGRADGVMCQLMIDVHAASR